MENTTFFLIIFLKIFIGADILEPVGCIVGGGPATFGTFSYQLSVRINGRHKCGGSIVAPKWALSAAHCFINAKTADVTMRAGSTISTFGGILVPAKKIYVHPNFNQKNGDFDVALVLTSKTFSGTNISSIALPVVGASLPVGAVAVISGWGLTAVSEVVNPIYLQSVTVTLLTRLKCVNDYASLATIDDNLFFCAGGVGHDSCQGDSGGPIVIDSIQVGIISGGVGCGHLKYPGLYTNLADFRIRNWIRRIARV